MAAVIHILNAVGALCLVYALRERQPIILVPMTALVPVITIVLSLGLYARIPPAAQLTGMCLAAAAIYLLAD